MDNKETEFEMLKEILLSDPMDIYNEDLDIKESNIELVEEREVSGELSREIGSANLYLATAFLYTANNIDIPAKDREQVEIMKTVWRDAINLLKQEGFVREKPSSVRESFKLV